MPKPRPCSLCRVRPRTVHVTSSDLCDVCADYAGWENTHSDEQHDELLLPGSDPRCENCPICNFITPPWENAQEEIIMTKTASTKVKKAATRTNPKQVHVSHASCSHPRTPAGRAACRKARRNNDTPATAPKIETFPSSKIGKGVAVHLVLALPTSDDQNLISPLCSNGKKVLPANDTTTPRPITDVTCKNCLKLH